jgi:hypothetical protein
MAAASIETVKGNGENYGEYPAMKTEKYQLSAMACEKVMAYSGW